MFKRFKRWHEAAVARDVEHFLWISTLEHLVKFAIDYPDEEICRQKLRKHIADGVSKGFVPYNTPKSNKKLLEIK